MKQLLLIEDDCFMREMITMVLESENYKVVGVESGAEALLLLEQCKECRAVIADMYLPDTDGIKLYKQIGIVNPEAMFIILSSETAPAIVQQANSLGITYIFKDENFAESILASLKSIV